MKFVGISHDRKLCSFLNSAAENEPFYRVCEIAVQLHCFFYMAYALVAYQFCKACLVINRFAVYCQIGKTVVMERAEQIFFKRFLQSDFIRDVVVEKRENIESVSPFRCCGKTEQKFRRKIADYFFV